MLSVLGLLIPALPKSDRSRLTAVYTLYFEDHCTENGKKTYWLSSWCDLNRMVEFWLNSAAFLDLPLLDRCFLLTQLMHFYQGLRFFKARHDTSSNVAGTWSKTLFKKTMKVNRVCDASSALLCHRNIIYTRQNYWFYQHFKYWQITDKYSH